MSDGAIIARKLIRVYNAYGIYAGKVSVTTVKLSGDCMVCLIQRQWEQVSRCEDEQAKASYMIDVLRTVAEAEDGATAPLVVARITKLYRAYFGNPTGFDKLKAEYNARLLQMEDENSSRIKQSVDPLAAALKLARAGNYIDFGAMGSVEDDKLVRLIADADGETLDENVYSCFVRDLENARRLVYLTDNCGEIVLDKLLVQTIRSRYPSLEVTAIVRGAPVLNDATEEDARAVGLPDAAYVLGNGTDIAGTQLEAISEEARRQITGADLIISKGQGNFETLHGCGLNIYYLFLCKCDWFTKRFGLERYRGVFVNERDCRFAEGAG